MVSELSHRSCSIDENTYVIYQTWVNKDTKVIPKNFLMKLIRNEVPEERKVRQSLVFSQFESEINLLKIRADRHNSQCKEVHREKINYLEGHYRGDILIELQRLWNE